MKNTYIAADEELVAVNQEFNSAFRSIINEQVKGFESQASSSSMFNAQPSENKKQLIDKQESFFTAFSHLSWLHEDQNQGQTKRHAPRPRFTNLTKRIEQKNLMISFDENPEPLVDRKESFEQESMTSMLDKVLSVFTKSSLFNFGGG